MMLQREGRGKAPPLKDVNPFLKGKGVLVMTALLVFIALIAANVAYSIHDARRCETDRQMDNFYRVEYKKSYLLRDEETELANGWY